MKKERKKKFNYYSIIFIATLFLINLTIYTITHFDSWRYNTVKTWWLEPEDTAEQICVLLGYNTSGTIGISNNELEVLDCWHTKIEYSEYIGYYETYDKGDSIICETEYCKIST